MTEEGKAEVQAGGAGGARQADKTPGTGGAGRAGEKAAPTAAHRGGAGPLRGRAWKFGDNVDTDAIIPARYLNTSDPAELARHCMEDADPSFAGRVQPGDLVVAGENFGCGSSREHAPISLRAAGVGAVIAASFARIFYRNAINIGLPILESAEAAARIQDGDRLEIDLAAGEIRNLTRNETYRAQPLPEFIRELVAAGGLIPYVRGKLERERKQG